MRCIMINTYRSKQSWNIGDKVKVGFMRDLEVVATKPTPGDYAPDAYLLERNSKYYEFVPHNGLRSLPDFKGIIEWVRS